MHEHCRNEPFIFCIGVIFIILFISITHIGGQHILQILPQNWLFNLPLLTLYIYGGWLQILWPSSPQEVRLIFPPYEYRLACNSFNQ